VGATTATGDRMDGTALTRADLPPVLVVGLGLIGGSVALDLRAAGATVRGVSRSETAVRRALEIGAIERGGTSLADEAPHAGVILVAAPVRTSIRLLSEAAASAPPGAVITDACSSKREVVAAMDRLPPTIRAVGGHPMAGKESSGIEAAEAGLFKGATWVLSESVRTDDEARRVGELLAEMCGAVPLWTDATEHDEAVAAISHLPLLTAAALVLAAEDSGSELMWRLAAGGFRDATRLAAGDEWMGSDLLLTNSHPLSEAHARFTARLEELAAAASAADEAALFRLLRRAAERRRSMYGWEQPR